MLHAVTCLFNPCQDVRIVENYWVFRDRLPCALTTVELSFDGNFAVPDAIQIAGSAQHILWQKERLLNVAIQTLPPEVDMVAWLDADMIFAQPDWTAEVERALSLYSVVQLFEIACDLGPDGEVIRGMRGVGTMGLRGFPGGAWAARREVLSAGLFDKAILGGGDRLMTMAHARETALGILSHYPKGLLRAFWAWARAQQGLTDGRIGAVPGIAYHLFHGPRSNRLYMERLEHLRAFDFDPETDIDLDDNGLWRWSSDKSGLHAAVATYFDLRQRDSG